MLEIVIRICIYDMKNRCGCQLQFNIIQGYNTPVLILCFNSYVNLKYCNKLYHVTQ